MESNELFEIRTKISNETGVPVELLDGETEEDNRSRALAIMAFKKGHGSSGTIDPKDKENNTAKQFALWFNNQLANKNKF